MHAPAARFDSKPEQPYFHLIAVYRVAVFTVTRVIILRLVLIVSRAGNKNGDFPEQIIVHGSLRVDDQTVVIE